MGASDALEAVLLQMAEADIQFHKVLVARAGGERLARVHATQVSEARICIHALGSTRGTDQERLSRAPAHRGALRAGDATLADDLLAQHMTDAVDELARLSETSPLPEAVPRP